MTLFEPYLSDRCCLCGSTDAFSGEHAIKASALRRIFGREEMVVGSFRRGSQPRFAQGSKSKIFHYEAPLCTPCNSARTQPYDQEFDRFDAMTQSLVAIGERPKAVMYTPRYARSSPPFLDVVRYFAKLLACQIAECGGPRCIALIDFALGRSDFAPLELELDLDPAARRWTEATGDQSFAGRGGLEVSFLRTCRLANGIRSTLTLGLVRYTFTLWFMPEVAREMRSLAPDFHMVGEEALARSLRAGQGTLRA